MKKILFILMLLSSSHIISEIKYQNTENGWGAELSGYIKPEAALDTRQIVAEGDGEDLLFPAKRLLDVQCKDINAHGQMGFYAIETRIRGEFFGPEFRAIKNPYVNILTVII